MGNWETLKKEIKSISVEEKREIEMMSEIVSQIIVAREELGLSQRQLAELADMNQSALARMEMMRITPRLDTVCHAFSYGQDVTSGMITMNCLYVQKRRLDEINRSGGGFVNVAIYFPAISAANSLEYWNARYFRYGK